MSERLEHALHPWDTTWGMIGGLAALASIGFTMSLFVTGLAFPSDSLAESHAKVGILAGSAIAALLGAALLLAEYRRHDRRR